MQHVETVISSIRLGSDQPRRYRRSNNELVIEYLGSECSKSGEGLLLNRSLTIRDTWSVFFVFHLLLIYDCEAWVRGN